MLLLLLLGVVLLVVLMLFEGLVTKFKASWQKIKLVELSTVWCRRALIFIVVLIDSLVEASSSFTLCRLFAWE